MLKLIKGLNILVDLKLAYSHKEDPILCAMRWFSRAVLKLLGWKVKGTPAVVPKSLVVVIPHTSNWDFPLGLLLRSAIGVDIKYMGKSSLFKPPYGWLMKKLGGYPVYRDKSTRLVDAIAGIIKKEKSIHVCITPEGTRAKVAHIKTGFYYIAEKADIPLFLLAWDAESKVLDFGEPYYLTGNIIEDLKYVYHHLENVKGLIPANSGLDPFSTRPDLDRLEARHNLRSK